MKALVVIGTRPEAVKLAPVIIALRDRAEIGVCTTGQHPGMATDALREFGLIPDVELEPPSSDRTLAELMATMITQLDRAIETSRPNWVIVQGDTTSAFAGGLAGFYRRVPVAHVEAGLRTGDLAAPFPEEANRAMLARIAAVNFASTKRARDNLLAEGIDPAQISVVGNTVIDAVRLVRAGWTAESEAATAAQLGITNRPLVLVTCHRRENQDEVLRGICGALAELARRYTTHQWLFPMHPNPELRSIIRDELAHLPNLQLREPLSYQETLVTLSRASLVVTDSGGLQEEIAAFAKPVVVLREITERPEGIEAGFASLVGREPLRIVAEVRGWLDAPERAAALAGRPNPYGDGHAAERIADHLLGTG